MMNPDDLSLMTEKEKLELLRRISEAEDWQESFELIYLALMNDESAAVRREAVAALWNLAEARHIELLIDKVENDPDVEVRGKAASVLGIFVYEAIVEGTLDETAYLALRKYLLDVARDETEELLVRRMAVEALSFDPQEDVHDLIAWAYGHPLVEVRMSAVFAMVRTRSSRWAEAILAELDSADCRILLEAINAAGEAELAAATPKLRNFATGKDRELRLASIWALAHTGGPGAVETLEMCAQSDDEEVRDLAGEAIEEFYSSEELDDEPAEGESGEDDE